MLTSIVLVALVALGGANAQCSVGPAGTNATANVTFSAGCVTERYTGMSAPVTTCNGTNGAAGADGDSVTVVNGATQTCDIIATATQSVAICNGAVGPQGATGAQGPQGLPAPLANVTLVTVGNTSSWQISNGTASLVLANMTSPQGLQGLQGPIGPNGTNGFNGSTGAAGFMGPMPGYLVVAGSVSLCTGGGISTSGFGAVCPTFNTQCSCASKYALSRAGIQQAINDGINICSGASVAQCAAIVSVGGNVVSDGVALQLGSYITLDFNGFTFSAVANSSTQDLITALGGALGSTQALTATAASSNTTIQVASTTGYLVGDVVVLTGGTLNGVTPGGTHSNRAAQQTNIVTAVNAATGTITLRHPLAWDFMTSLSATIQRVAGPLVYGGLRNVILNANGNTGAFTRLLVIERVQYFRMERVTITGTLANSFTGSVAYPSIDYFYAIAGIQVSVAADSAFLKTAAKSFTTGSNTVRDVAFMGLTSSTVRVLRSELSGGAGPAILFSVYSVVDTVMVQQAAQSNFKIDTCAYCQFSGIISNAAGNATAAAGLGFGFGSHHNTVKGAITIGNQYAGITFQGDLDAYNNIRGFKSIFNKNQTVVFGTTTAGAQGNSLSGHIDMQPGGVPMFVFDSNSLEQVNNVNGHILFSVSGQTPAASDFVGNRQVIFSVGTSGATDNQLRAYLKGTDGVPRWQHVTYPATLA